MSFKKYLLSMSICLVFVFVLIGRLFIPLQTSATSDIDWDSYIVSLCTLNNIATTDYVTVSQLQSANWGGNSNTLTQYNNFISQASANGFDSFLYVYRVFSADEKQLIIYSFSSSNVSSVSYSASAGIVVYFFNTSSAYCSFSARFTGFSSSVLKYYSSSYGSSYSKHLLTYATSSSFSVTSQIGAKTTIEDDSTFLGRLVSGVKELLTSTFDNTLEWGDTPSDVVDKVTDQVDAYKNFVKGILGIEDDDTETLGTVLQNVYNNDYTSDYWTDIDTDVISRIKTTSSNMKTFLTNNITISTGDDGDTYYYTVKNYDTTTNTYPQFYYDTDYFNNYLLADSSSGLDLSNTNQWLKWIYGLEYTIGSNIVGLRTTLLNGFAIIQGSIDSNFNALGGVGGIIAGGVAGGVAGALGIVDADFSLDSLLDNLNLNLGDLLADFEAFFNDDTIFNIDMSSDFKTSLGDLLGNVVTDIDNNFDTALKTTLKGLLDDIVFKVELNDNSVDVDNTINNNNPSDSKDPDTSSEPETPTDPDDGNTPSQEPEVTTMPVVGDSDEPTEDPSNPSDDGDDGSGNGEDDGNDNPSDSGSNNSSDDEEDQEDDFWKAVRNEVIEIVPFYGQCLELIEYDHEDEYLVIDSNNGYYLTDGTTNSFSTVSVGVDVEEENTQLTFDSVVSTSLFDGAVLLKSSADNSTRLLAFPVQDVTFFGYEFPDIYIDISTYYRDYRQKVSNILLAFFYLMFAWSVVHRVARVFGGSRSDNDNSMEE